MIQKKFLKHTIIFSVAFLFSIFFILSSKSNAFADATLYFYPTTGGIVEKVGNQFTVDVMLNSPTDEITEVSFVVLFDPRYLQITEAIKNNSLFKTWSSTATDEVYWSIDNKNGVAFLRGFTQAGSGTLYKSKNGADVLARIKFKTLLGGKTELEWQINAPDTSHPYFVTKVMANKSPTTNVLNPKPTSITIQIGDPNSCTNCGNGTIDEGEECDTASDINTCDAGYTCSPNTCTCVKLPGTAIGIKDYIVAIGFFLIALGIFMILSRPIYIRKRKGTIIHVKR